MTGTWQIAKQIETAELVTPITCSEANSIHLLSRLAGATRRITLYYEKYADFHA